MKNLFVISGGVGKECDISILSGKNISEELKNVGVPFESMFISKDKFWIYKDKEISQEEALQILAENNALVFQVIHGTFGEDGELHALFEKKGISYVGSNSESMKLTIDKYKTEKLLIENNITTTNSFLISKDTDLSSVKLTFPVFLKPSSEGSSVGLNKVFNQQELENVLQKTLPIYKYMLAQEYISGREFTCGIAEINGEIVELSPSEVIFTTGEVFDYDAKYTENGGAKEITPADIDTETTKRIQELAKKVHLICGCKDLSRTDIIMRENGELVVLEINTLPGMTKMSFIPVELKVSGYSLLDFINSMIKKYS